MLNEFHGELGFWVYEEHLRKTLQDVRGHETIVRWLESRKELAKAIDPATAEVFCEKGLVLDPYCILPPHEDNYGAINCFARNPGSKDWIYFGDLPEAIEKALKARMSAGEFDDDSLPF